MTPPILVTGGTGRLGRHVVSRLVDAGCDVRVLARHSRDTSLPATFFTGDLLRGEGIDPAVSGVSAIIQCATSTKGDADATRNLVKAAIRSCTPHLVQPSIVGIDLMSSWGYVKTKLEVERIVENSGLPWTILRATQFFDYCFDNSRKLARIPLVAPVPAGFRVQPVDADDVAAQLVAFALGKPAGRAPDVAGPQVSTWLELFRSYLAATDRHRWVVPVRIPGSKAVRNGALLPPPRHTVGTRTWDQYLTARTQEQPSDLAAPRIESVPAQQDTQQTTPRQRE
jgi:uncharacterized protein YbjT (DUF2867 family)